MRIMAKPPADERAPEVWAVEFTASDRADIVGDGEPSIREQALVHAADASGLASDRLYALAMFAERLERANAQREAAARAGRPPLVGPDGRPLPTVKRHV